MPMEVKPSQLFVFSSVINGTRFEYGRIGDSQDQAANALADDLDKYVAELRAIAKSKAGLKAS